MPTQHPVFIYPDDLDIKIWRYINLEKFTSLLTTNALYFARADKLEDQFEGSIPKNDKKILALEKNDSEELENNIGDLNKYKDKFINEDIVPENVRQGLAIHRRNIKEKMFINCWHMNYHESAAMWKLYGNHVCIQSTFRKLHKVLPDRVGVKDNYTTGCNLYLGQVKYIDYSNESTYTGDLEIDTNEYRFFVHKRKSYEHEKEVRAIINTDLINSHENGLLLKIDINQLIERVYVKPNASHEFFYIVKTLIDKNNLNVDLKKSDLDQDPLY
jgi:hypothetical protein